MPGVVSFFILRPFGPRRLRTAPPPSTRVRVFDRDECEALRDAPVTKGKVSLLEAAGAPRLIKIDSGRVYWETRAKATGYVAKCTQHNEYEEEYAAMRANPRLMEAMRSFALCVHEAPSYAIAATPSSPVVSAQDGSKSK